MRPGFDPWVGKSLEKGKYSSVFWPGEYNGLYSPWAHKESDTTWQLNSNQICPQMLLLSLLPPIVYSYSESLPVFCDPTDCNLQGSSVHGISQARILEWVAISYYKGSIFPTQELNPRLLHCKWIYPWATKEAHSILYALLNI